MVLPRCYSQQEKTVDKTQKITCLNSGHILLWFHLGQIYTLLHLSDIHILKI